MRRKGLTSSLRAGGLLLAYVCLAGVGVAICQDTTQPYYSIHHPSILMMMSGTPDEMKVARDALSYAVTSVNFPITFIDDPKIVDAKSLAQFQIFIQFGVADYDASQQKALADFVTSGGGFLALHDAIDGGSAGSAYAKLLGGSLVRHAGPYEVMVHMTDAGRKSPIMAGVRDFEILEQQVFPEYTVDPAPAFRAPGPEPGSVPTPSAAPAVPNVARSGSPGQPSFRGAGQTHVLMTGFAMDNTVDPERLKLRTNQISDPVAGWWQETGTGRVCYLSMGNTFAVMNYPTVQQLYENALRWLAHLD